MTGKIHRENSLAEIVASRGEVVRPLGVLIAEGKDLVAGRLTTQLEGLGHRVLAVTTDAHAAVESAGRLHPDRKSTRLNSSHGYISYAVFCLKKKKRSKKISQHQLQRSC